MLTKIKKVFQKPPSYVLWRLKQEAKAELARFWEPYFAQKLNEQKLLSYFGETSINSLWSCLSSNTFPTLTEGLSKESYLAVTEQPAEAIFEKAQKAMEHKVTLLGLRDAFLGHDIDWGKDYKTNRTWPKTYFRSIDYVNLDEPSDVKIPWEISRFQWMMPLGQAYILSGDEKYAEKTKTLLLDWITKNPYTMGVNWACTMEVAIRIVVMTWFFHVFKKSASWQDQAFQFEFLKSLFLHAHYTVNHLEKSDVNGNHYIADAMGLVYAGLFFGKDHVVSRNWFRVGWEILTSEIKIQIHDDGVDYENSTHYHRLVFEIFYLSALYVKQAGLTTPTFYLDKLFKMADYTAHYTQPDGLCPLVGDNDDARILPFGLQDINDHRYVTELVLLGLEERQNLCITPSDRTELFWYFDASVIQKLDRYASAPIKSKAFPHGGYYIMKHEDNHVFICCAPLGLQGRGGHSHNDALSFELVLRGEKVITDSGSYNYTGDYKARNYYRSTAAHNAPYIEGVEINSFIDEKYLWNMKDEAKPECLVFEETDAYILFKGRHFGYTKIDPELVVEREIKFEKESKKIDIKDQVSKKNLQELLCNLIFVKENEAKKFQSNNKTPYDDFLKDKQGKYSPNYGIEKKSVVLYKKNKNHYVIANDT